MHPQVHPQSKRTHLKKYFFSSKPGNEPLISQMSACTSGRQYSALPACAISDLSTVYLYTSPPTLVRHFAEQCPRLNLAALCPQNTFFYPRGEFRLSRSKGAYTFIYRLPIDELDAAALLSHCASRTHICCFNL